MVHLKEVYGLNGKRIVRSFDSFLAAKAWVETNIKVAFIEDDAENPETADLITVDGTQYAIEA